MARNPRKAPKEPAHPAPPEADQDGLKLKETATTPKVAYQGTVWTNTASDIIQITEDKAIIALDKFARRLSMDGLVAPFGIEISLVALLVTSDFKTKHLGLAAGTWHAIFVAATILVSIWLLAAVVSRFIRGGRKKAVKACIKEMKGA